MWMLLSVEAAIVGKYCHDFMAELIFTALTRMQMLRGTLNRKIISRLSEATSDT